jgi:hypothetical protein
MDFYRMELFEKYYFGIAIFWIIIFWKTFFWEKVFWNVKISKMFKILKDKKFNFYKNYKVN